MKEVSLSTYDSKETNARKTFAQDRAIIKCHNWNMSPDVTVTLTSTLYDLPCLLFMPPMWFSEPHPIYELEGTE